MYHTREATVLHDKVYALLGMSSDGLGAASLSPDYDSMEELLQRLIEFILCKEVSVETWDERETAVIKSKGCILGHVSSVESDSTRYDRQNVEVTSTMHPSPWSTRGNTAINGLSRRRQNLSGKRFRLLSTRGFKANDY